MRQTRYITTLIAALCLYAVTALAQNTTTITTDTTTPVVGLATSETMQVNLINTATASHSGTAASCTGSVAFYTFGANPSTSAIVGSATNFTLTSGELSSFTLKGSASGRIYVRAVIALTQVERSGVPCTLATNIETYDNSTGATHVHLELGSPLVAVIQAIAAPPTGH